MHRLQELVRLHRMGTGAREVAQLLRMSPNTERAYRKVLASARLLDGSADALPELAVLREAVGLHLPSKDKPQHESSIAEWTEVIEKMLGDGAAATAIYDCLRLQHEDFGGSLSAVKRLCKRLQLQEQMAGLQRRQRSPGRSGPPPCLARSNGLFSAWALLTPLRASGR